MKSWLSKLSVAYHWLIEPILVVVVLLVGFLAAMNLSASKKPPKTAPKTVDYAPLVKTVLTRTENTHLLIKGNGTLQARTRIRIVPQVGGRVTRIHPQLRAGGQFRAQETLLTIEPEDYQLAVTRAEAEVASAEKTLNIEQAEAQAAEQEWQALHPQAAVPILVGRGPQIAEAQASLKAARAALRQAQLNLQRTRIQLPFAGRVVEASVDIGEVISANQSVGTVYSHERFEIPVPLELAQLSRIKTANAAADGIGSPVRIRLPVTDPPLLLNGQLERLESELDSTSRMARAIVDLPASAIPDEWRERVIPGLFADVEIQGQALTSVTLIPRAWLRENNRLWVLNEGRLHFHYPKIIHQSDSTLYLRGVPPDTSLITSQLDVVTEGMSLRTPEPAE